MEIDNRIVYVALIALMMVAALSAFLIVVGLESVDSDPRDESHEYTVSGTVDGEECDGAGTSEYVEETDNARLYQFTLTLDVGGAELIFEFGFAFDLDDQPLSLYQYVGSETRDGTELDAWFYEEDGTEYTFYVGEYCTVYRVDVQSSVLDLVVDIVRGGIK